jgi:UDP:flavonoid glycosyltransferase YjiC (YdhE family)
MAPPPRLDTAPRLLFVPVSGASGSGEYVRCLMLANAARDRWPGAVVHFLLSAAAPYAAATPYETTLFPSSPTLHDAAGRAAIERFAPQIAVFDNAGRSGQLAAARAAGARVVYLSSRPRSRTKAFRLLRLRHLDELWIPYPEFTVGGLTPYESMKVRLLGRPRLRYLDYLLPRVPAATGAATLTRFGVSPDRFVLVAAGGGSGHPGGGERAPEIYAEVARKLGGQGHTVLALGVEPAAGDHGTVRWAGRVAPADIAALLAGARLAVTNGGATLLQSLACGRPTVAAPVAADQVARLARCAARGGVVSVALEAQALVGAALRLLESPDERASLAAGARGLKLVNGVDTAMAAFAALLASTAPAQPAASLPSNSR